MKSVINKRIRLTADIAMTVLLPMLMAYSLIGETFHEVIGTLMLALFMFHHVMNRKWHSSIFKGKYTVRRIVQTLMDLVLLVIMLLQPVSGILMSKNLYTFIELPGITAIVRELHLVIAYWGFVLMFVHAGMHLVPLIHKMTGKNKRISIILHSVWILISGYGVYVFIKRAMPEYMLHRQIFAFIDVSESKLLFFADHAAVMLLFMLAGYAVAILMSGNSSSKKVS